MLYCVQIIVDDPHNKREMGGGGGSVQCVGVPVRYQLSRRVAGCPRFWSSSGSGFWPLFTPWLPSAQTIPTRQFSSSDSTGMGGNSPTTYTLQGSSLKTWVNFHPGRVPRQICVVFTKIKKIVFHKRTKPSESTSGEK